MPEIEKSCSSYSNENKPSFFLMAFIHSCQVTGVTGRILCDAASNVKVIVRARLEMKRPKSISDKKKDFNVSGIKWRKLHKLAACEGTTGRGGVCVCVSMLVCVREREREGERAYITAVNGWLYK